MVNVLMSQTYHLRSPPPTLRLVGSVNESSPPEINHIYQQKKLDIVPHMFYIPIMPHHWGPAHDGEPGRWGVIGPRVGEYRVPSLPDAMVSPAEYYGSVL